MGTVEESLKSSLERVVCVLLSRFVHGFIRVSPLRKHDAQQQVHQEEETLVKQPLKWGEGDHALDWYQNEEDEEEEKPGPGMSVGWHHDVREVSRCNKDQQLPTTLPEIGELSRTCG